MRGLPSEGFKYFKAITRTVDDCGEVRVDNRWYGLPPSVIEQEVIIHVFDRYLEIFNKEGVLIKTHTKLEKPGDHHIDDEDRLFNPSRKTQKLIERAESIGPMTANFCRAVFQELGRPGQKMLYGVVNFARKYKAEQIESACELALKREHWSYHGVRRILERMQEEVPKIELTQKDQLIRPSKDYQQFWDNQTNQTGGEENGYVYH